MKPYQQQPAASAIEFLPDLPPVLDVLDAQFVEQVQHMPNAPPSVRGVPLEQYAGAPASKAGAVVGLVVVLAALVVGGLSIADMTPPAPVLARSQSGASTVAGAAPVRKDEPDRVFDAPAVRLDAAPAIRRARSLDDLRLEPKADGEATETVRIVASKATANPVLVRALDAWNAGDLAAAEAAYASALVTEPRHAGALGGLAAIALRRGQYQRAEGLYLRALEADPANAVAMAGVLGLQHRDDAFGVESRLKNLIAAQPDQPALRFALGNIYAGDDRWNEAQREYFHAYSGDPQQPDYLFNLAVSLDHLRQPTLAAEYYASALAAASLRPAEFDRSKASGRLRELTE